MLINDLLHLFTSELAEFLRNKLPQLSQNWWHQNVVSRLSFQQQRMLQERRFESIEDLDLAALLRVTDQNWYELSQLTSLPREGRSWLKELQTVRNKWAHLSSQSIESSEVYRDADTLSRFLNLLMVKSSTLEAVDAAKQEALANMAAEQGLKVFSETHLVDDVTYDETAKNNEGPIFGLGDLVTLRSNPAVLMPVVEVNTSGAEIRYVVFHDSKKATYYESQLGWPEHQAENTQKLNASELKAYLTSLQLLSPSAASLHSLRTGRVKFVPYQYRPVLKLIRADRPRLLIADEVGVGKTIEAGLIIKELRARMDISSVLIICPKALVAERKWFLEMKRFDEHFTAFDGSLLRHCLQETHLDGEWPEQYAKAILPFSLFDSDLLFGKERRGRRNNEGLLALDPPPKFDLVIVDEAHHIRNSDTYLHQAVRYFCDNAQAAVFLTATPVQLGSEDLFTLLNVLRPDLVIDHASFEQMAEPNRFINMAAQYCRSAQNNWQTEARACLDDVANTSWGRLFMRESPEFQALYDLFGSEEINNNDRIRAIRSLEELYTFSPMINRTRRRDIGEFTTRKPETLTIEFTPEQRVLHDELLDVVARILQFAHGQQNVKFMMTTLRRQSASCLYGLAPMLRDMLTGKLDSLELSEAEDDDLKVELDFISQVREDIQRLLLHAENLSANDPKVTAFLKVLIDKSKMENNKSLVFTTFRHTLSYIAKYAESAGLRYGLIHGGIPDEQRAELRHRFALPKKEDKAIDVLLSSEVGCEGLDFQFCDLLINYDLPWNPMRVEQRIGRIDRYGQQSETIAIVNMVTPGTVDAEIYERCLWRIGVFQHAVGGSEEILGEITQEIQDIGESYSLSDDEREQRLQQIGDNGIRLIEEEQNLEQKQAELFGLTVPNQSWQQEIESAESFWLSPLALQGCVNIYLSSRARSDTEFLLGEKAQKTLRLGQEMRGRLLEDFRMLPRASDPIARHWEKWLKGTEPLLQVTFDQEAATSNLDVVHLNVLHPLVRLAAMHQERAESIHVDLNVECERLPPGTYSFAIYHWRKVGLKQDDSLVVISDEPSLDDSIMSMLAKAKDHSSDAIADSKIDKVSDLERKHHTRWISARADHIAENQELVEHRGQSLRVSHAARCKLLEEQIERANNDKIRRMKESELARARSDYERRLAELEKTSNSADILANPIVHGTLTLIRQETR